MEDIEHGRTNYTEQFTCDCNIDGEVCKCMSILFVFMSIILITFYILIQIISFIINLF